VNHNNKDMKMYARVGLRSPEEWNAIGREVEAGITPRTTATYQGKAVDLYSRDQTRIRPARPRPAVATVATAPTA
jgi:hypothetical protein